MQWIRNADELAHTPDRQAALEIAEAGLSAIDTRTVTASAVRRDGSHLVVDGESYNLSEKRHIYLIGVGKCAAQAAHVLEEMLGDTLTDGLVFGVGESPVSFRQLRYQSGTHPMPSARNVSVSEQLISLLSETTEDDLVLTVVSGGGSTLLCLPDVAGSCDAEETIVASLYADGATIQEINTVRKHLSRVRGGNLAYHAYPAAVVSLVYSDIPGGDVTHVASGPTVRDESTTADAVAVLDRYNLLADGSITTHMLLETPKDAAYFDQVRNVCVVSNEQALAAMQTKAADLGFRPCINATGMCGEARTVGADVVERMHTATETDLHLYGGETTVTVTGSGTGGRNQELALGALMHVTDRELVLALASDGRDNTDAAGAIADTLTRQHAKANTVDPQAHLEDNDAYTFFSKTGDQIITGKTGANVADLLIVLRTGVVS